MSLVGEARDGANEESLMVVMPCWGGISRLRKYGNGNGRWGEMLLLIGSGFVLSVVKPLARRR